MKETRVGPAIMISLGVLAGAAMGIGGYTFIYAKGSSYLTDSPSACANCHIMQGQFDGWVKGVHRSAAVCNDCHTPAGFAAKYSVKAVNGFWHSFAFTTGLFHEPIQIKPRNLGIVENACRRCHEDIVSAIDGPHRGADAVLCVKCHSDVGH